MTINEAIARVDDLRPNTMSTSEKIRLLARLDGKIKAEIIDAHEGSETVMIEPYTDEDLSRELLVPFPYDDLYVHYLDAYISYALGEFKRYNSAILLYNAGYHDFAAYYRRTHMPRQARRRVL